MKATNETVYVLTHVYEYGENNEFDEIKELGIYSTRQKAEEAIERYCVLEGFNRYPRSCFQICEQRVDVDYEWTEGFMTAEEIEMYQSDNDICQSNDYKKSIYQE